MYSALCRPIAVNVDVEGFFIFVGFWGRRVSLGLLVFTCRSAILWVWLVLRLVVFGTGVFLVRVRCVPWPIGLRVFARKALERECSSIANTLQPSQVLLPLVSPLLPRVSVLLVDVLAQAHVISPCKGQLSSIIAVVFILERVGALLVDVYFLRLMLELRVVAIKYSMPTLEDAFEVGLLAPLLRGGATNALDIIVVVMSEFGTMSRLWACALRVTLLTSASTGVLSGAGATTATATPTLNTLSALLDRRR